MNVAPDPIDDLTAVRAALGHTNPQPDPTLPHQEVLAARAAVGMARVAPRSTPRLRGRFVAAGAVAVLSVATLAAVVIVPSRQGTETVELATGPGAKAVLGASAATEAAGTARGLLTVTSGGHTVTASGVGSFTSGDGSAVIALDGQATPSPSMTVLRTSSGIYVRPPAGLNPLSSDKPWLSVDAATLTRLTRLALGDLGSQINGAPLDALTYLRAVSGEVVVAGPDTVRGEPATRYRGVIDPAKVVGQLPEALRLAAADVAGAAPRNLPADLGIDDQGRLRKLVLVAEQDAGSAAGGPPNTDATDPGRTATVTFELFDFGVPVQVEAPPADDVTDVGGLLGTFLQNATRP